jgi:GTP cyclohydrolase II
MDGMSPLTFGRGTLPFSSRRQQSGNETARRTIEWEQERRRVEMHVPHRVIRPHAQLVATTTLPTRHGNFQTHVFRSEEENEHLGQPQHSRALAVDHVALVYGDVRGKSNVPVRVHSECLTSEVFGSLKCDCKQQLEAAMAEVGRRGAGAILYLRQEGRGIGLANKIRAYALQSDGHDTVDANRLLGLPDDARDYGVARDMLAELGIKSIKLMTNNPDKVEKLRALGIEVSGRLPVVIAPNPHSLGYLEAKRLRMAHDLPQRPVPVMPLAANGDAE